MGCALIGRREELLAMGGFDEAFWFHGTDLELCARAGRRGRVVRWEAGELVHVGHRQWDRARRQKSRRATAQWLLRDLTVAARALVGGLASSGRR
jgi:GT2 family glycosyltransferase